MDDNQEIQNLDENDDKNHDKLNNDMDSDLSKGNFGNADDQTKNDIEVDEDGNGDQENVENQLQKPELDFIPDDDEILDESDLIGDEDVLDEVPKKEEKTEEDYQKEFMKNQIEAVLFVSGQAVTAEEIGVKLGVAKSTVEELLSDLAIDYLERTTAIEIANVSEKYIMQLKPEFTSSVKSFASGGLIREAIMRTLTIIAAKQPILQSDLSKIRSTAGQHLKELMEMGLIKRTPKGRSFIIVTTDKFADMFGFSRNVQQMKEQIQIYLTSTSDDDEE